MGFCSVEVKPEGPFQLQAVALAELAIKVTLLPVQTGLVLVAPVDDGIGLTVAVIVYTVACVQPVPVLLIVSE